VIAYDTAPFVTAADDAAVSTGAATVATGLSFAGLSQPTAPMIDAERVRPRRIEALVMGDLPRKTCGGLSYCRYSCRCRSPHAIAMGRREESAAHLHAGVAKMKTQPDFVLDFTRARTIDRRSAEDPRERGTLQAMVDAPGGRVTPNTISIDGGPLPSIERLTPGTVLDRYIVMMPLGEGGAGIVYAAYDPELDRKVAVKARAIVASNASAAPPRGASDGRLSHPNVVAVYDVGTFRDRVFVAMECRRRVDAAAWVEKHTRSWREVLDTDIKAGRGLVQRTRRGSCIATSSRTMCSSGVIGACA